MAIPINFKLLHIAVSLDDVPQRGASVDVPNCGTFMDMWNRGWKP